MDGASSASLTEPLLDCSAPPDPPLWPPIDASTTRGLSSARAAKHLAIFGPNQLPTRRQPEAITSLRYFVGPLPVVVLLCVLLEMVQLDWFSTLLLLVLWIVHGAVGWLEHTQSSALSNDLAVSFAAAVVDVKRDREWTQCDVSELVPQDVIRLTLGSIVPADCRVLEDASQSTPRMPPVATPPRGLESLRSFRSFSKLKSLKSLKVGSHTKSAETANVRTRSGRVGLPIGSGGGLVLPPPHRGRRVARRGCCSLICQRRLEKRTRRRCTRGT